MIPNGNIVGAAKASGGGGSTPFTDITSVPADSLLGNPTGSTANASAISLGVENGFIGTTLVSTMEFADYFNLTTGADATAALQNFRIAGFINSVVRGAMNKGNIGNRARTKQRCMVSVPLSLSSPDVIPPFVDADAPLQILRNYPSSGSASAFWNGSAAANAFLNIAMPTVFISLDGHASEVQVNGNPDGTHLGAAIAGPRYWQFLSGGAGAVVGSQGNGLYQTGDIVTSSIGGLPSPFVAPTFSVTVSGGVVTTLTPVNLGILPMPPKMMRAAMGDPAVAWANPVTGGPTWTDCVANTSITKAAAVYDSSSNYITTTNSASGSGLTITIPDDVTAWNPDFSGALPTYLFQSAQCDSLFGNIKVASAGIVSDATYGPVIGWMLTNKYHFVNTIDLTGGYYTLYSNAVDVQIDAAHPTDGFCTLKIASGGDFICQSMILDSPTDHYMELDGCEGVQIKGRCFTSSGTDITGTASIYLGANSSLSGQLRNLDIDFEFDNAGKSTGIPAASIAFIQSSRINLEVSNIESKTGQTAAKQNSLFASFGSGVTNNNKITGSINGVFGQIYSGTLPSCYFNIWDAEVPLKYGSITATITGSATNNDTITLTFTNAGIFGFPKTAAITVTTSETTTQMATALAAAINAATGLTSYGVSATTNAANVVNIFQSGSQANNTVVTVAVTGGATEIVTLSNSGAISGAVSGGTFNSGGVYNIVMAGVPTGGATQSTGLNKAIAGSTVIDSTNNNLYMNAGTASNPNWLAQAFINQLPASAITSVTSASSPYTVLSSDYLVEVDTTGGAVTINLPNPAVRRRLKIKDTKGNFGANKCTLAPFSSEMIEGVAGNLVLWANWGNYELQSDGTNWYKVSAACNLAKASFVTHGTPTWIAPNGITNITAFGRAASGGGGGGGAGGGGSTIASAAGGGSGGNGGTVITIPVPLTVVPGTTYTLTIGTAGVGGNGGAPAAANAAGSTGANGGTVTAPTAGGNTTFGSLASWIGGAAGGNGVGGSLASAGTAGAAGSTPTSYTASTGGAGATANTSGSGGGSSTFRTPFYAAGSNGSGGAGTGASGGGGGGHAAPVAGDSSVSSMTPVSGAPGGTSGTPTGGSVVAIIANGVAGAGGNGGSAGGGGFLLATTGTQGGSGAAGGSGADGQIIIVWNE